MGIKRMGGCPQEKLDFSKERFIAEMNQYLRNVSRLLPKFAMTAEYKSYAYLPEDLLNQMLENAPRIAKQLAANH